MSSNGQSWTFHLKTTDMDEAKQKLSAAYVPIKMVAAPRTELDVSSSGASIGGITASSMRTESGMELHTAETCDAYHICSAYRGRMLLFGGTHVLEIPADGALHLWDSSAVTRSVLEPRSRLEGISVTADILHAALSDLMQAPVAARIQFAPRAERDTATFRSLILMARALQAGLMGDAPLASAQAAFTSLKESMIHLLLQGTRHNYSDRIGQQRSIAVRPRQVRRAMEYMQTYARQPLTIEEIASVAGVSTRALQWSFQRFSQISPMQYLRQMRLAGARQDLLDPAQPPSISVIAMKWGFSHMGLFALRYRAAYGELPRETLLRRR